MLGLQILTAESVSCSSSPWAVMWGLLGSGCCGRGIQPEILVGSIIFFKSQSPVHEKILQSGKIPAAEGQDTQLCTVPLSAQRDLGLQTGALCLKMDRMNPALRLCLCLISGDGRTGLDLSWL